MKRSLLVGILAMTVSAACGRSQEQKQAEQAAQQIAEGAQKVAQGAETAAGSAQKGMEQVAQGLQQMAQGAQQGLKPVDYSVLKELLPDVKGWERSDAKGEQVTMGISLSKAEARYQKADEHLKLEIVDTAFSQIVLAPFMMLARAGYEEKSDDGYKKGITLAGYPGFESFEKNGRDAEVHLLVGGRFLLNVDASNVQSAESARALVQAVNLAKLAALK